MSRPRSRAAILPAVWLGLFFAFPFLLVLRLSLSDTALAIPPYTPQIVWANGLEGIRAFLAALDGEMYRRLVSERLYVDAYLSSLRFAATGTVLALLVGYPMAYGMARSRPGVRSVLLMLVILPFWTSFLIRVYAWVG
ncbi:MAG TPA: putrescine ABC transporter permease PotH, partial [Caulobacter sp.]|nr:putrescine ABC transporter permease PotH [Caulobacter sp.]